MINYVMDECNVIINVNIIFNHLIRCVLRYFDIGILKD